MMIEACFEYSRVSHDSQMEVEELAVDDETQSLKPSHVLRLLFILIGNHANNLEYMETLWKEAFDLTQNMSTLSCTEIEYQHFSIMLDLISIWIGLKGGSRIAGIWQ